MSVLVILLLAVGGAALLIALATYAAAVVALRAPARPARCCDMPPIAVLKPLKGCDERLLENLRTFARQVYPSYQLVLGCEDVRDPALLVARQLQREFPDVDITVTAGAAWPGNNPKVANLRQLAALARHDLLLISDSDVRVEPDYLTTIATELADPNVGLVSSVIAGTDERTLGATFESLHLNSFIVGAICGADRIGHPCVVGKSMLFRKSEIGQLDGWRVARDVLAEDYVLGQLFHRAGRRVALCKRPVAAVNPSRSVMGFVERHVRWSQMRRRIAPLLYAGEPLLLPSAWFTLALLVSLGTTRMTWAATALFGLTLHAFGCAWVARALRGRRLPLADAALVPVKDTLMLALWLVAAFKTSVPWRGHRYRIGTGSLLTSLPSPRDADAAHPVWARHR